MRGQAAAWWGFHYGINGHTDVKDLLGASRSVLPPGAERAEIERLPGVPRMCALFAANLSCRQALVGG